MRKTLPNTTTVPAMNRSEARLERIRSVLAKRQKDLTLILNNVWDPHNVSAIYRSCDAFGIPDVHLYYSTAAFPSLGHKSSASAKKWVRTIRHTDPAAMVAELKASGHQVLCTCFDETARPHVAYDFTRPTAVILGNEHAGAEETLTRLADAKLYIPMMGMVQSLNVSVAAAVILAEAWRQRDTKAMYDAPSYPDEELNKLEDAWRGK